MRPLSAAGKGEPVGLDVRNDPAREDFLKQLRAGTCSHAYILEGPEGVGKAETARWFASALLCTGSEPPCGVCSACRKVQNGFHPDLHWYGGGEKQKAVSVGDVRDLIRNTSLLPAEGNRMVFVIENAQDMQAPAQNALLKVFEEPPEGVFLILLTESRKALLPTVRSRGRTVVLRGRPDAELEADLKARHPKERAEDIAAAVRSAEGSAGKAEDFLRPKAFQDRETVRGWMEAVFHGDRYARLAVIAAPKYKRETLLPLLDLFLRMASDVLLVKSGGNPVLLDGSEAKTYAASSTKKRLNAICSSIERCRERVESNGNLTADMTALACEL